jgi:hypothetical protein
MGKFHAKPDRGVGLGIHVDEEGTLTSTCQPCRKIDARCCFAGSTLVSREAENHGRPRSILFLYQVYTKYRTSIEFNNLSTFNPYCALE